MRNFVAMNTKVKNPKKTKFLKTRKQTEETNGVGAKDGTKTEPIFPSENSESIKKEC